jgi:hypothetical protein
MFDLLHMEEIVFISWIHDLRFYRSCVSIEWRRCIIRNIDFYVCWFAERLFMKICAACFLQDVMAT